MKDPKKESNTLKKVQESNTLKKDFITESGLLTQDPSFYMLSVEKVSVLV